MVFVCGPESHNFSVSIELGFVFVPVVEIDLISVREIEIDLISV